MISRDQRPMKLLAEFAIFSISNIANKLVYILCRYTLEALYSIHTVLQFKYIISVKILDLFSCVT